VLEALDKEISELDEIINILSDSSAITDSEDKESDIYMMKIKRNTFKTVKGLIKKASLPVSGIDKEIMMSGDEKKLFHKIIKFISFFRRIFKRT